MKLKQKFAVYTSLAVLMMGMAQGQNLVCCKPKDSQIASFYDSCDPGSQSNDCSVSVNYFGTGPYSLNKISKLNISHNSTSKMLNPKIKTAAKPEHR